MTPEFNAHRRFLLFGVLPVSLLMIAAPLSVQLAPEFNETWHNISNRQVASAFSTPSTIQPITVDPNAPRISPSVEPGLRRGRRMVALDVIRRLEEEARRQGGNTRLTPLDLRRLRNALRETESVPAAGQEDQENATSGVGLPSSLIPSSAVISPVQ